LLVLGAQLANVLLFWALPALLSALQLFTFGTYLPHRPAPPGFADRHNARSNDYPWLVSLLTCFHFGYHHEHHLSPGTPWWRLPTLRATRAKK
jgi:beta-carotene/zeaxanthin 4-ketolase